MTVTKSTMIKEIFDGSKWADMLKGLITFLQTLEPQKKYELNIKEYKERRSLRANDYSWVLTGKLAEKMLIAGARYSKDEMHAEMIFRYGVQETDESGDPLFWYVPDGVKVTDYYLYAKPIGSGRLGGKPTTQWQIFRPSHEYTRSEFNVFLQGIIAECEEQGIETKTPDEIARMISLIKDDEDG